MDFDAMLQSQSTKKLSSTPDILKSLEVMDIMHTSVNSIRPRKRPK